MTVCRVNSGHSGFMGKKITDVRRKSGGSYKEGFDEEKGTCCDYTSGAGCVLMTANNMKKGIEVILISDPDRAAVI